MKEIKSKVSLYDLLTDMPQDLIDTIDDTVYEYARKVAKENKIDFDLCGFSQKITVKIEIWEDKDPTE